MANHRTSIITDPKDAKTPPLTPAAQKEFDANQGYHKLHPHDGPEDMTTIERLAVTPCRLPFILRYKSRIRHPCRRPLFPFVIGDALEAGTIGFHDEQFRVGLRTAVIKRRLVAKAKT